MLEFEVNGIIYEKMDKEKHNNNGDCFPVALSHFIHYYS